MHNLRFGRREGGLLLWNGVDYDHLQTHNLKLFWGGGGWGVVNMSGLRSFTDLQCQTVREAGGGMWGVNMSGLRSFTDLQCQTVRGTGGGRWGVNMSGLRSFTDLQCQTVRGAGGGGLI